MIHKTNAILAKLANVKFWAKPDYIPDQLMRGIALPLLFIYCFLSFFNAITQEWTMFGFSFTSFLLLAVAIKYIGKPSFYWLLPLAAAVLPSLVIAYGIHQFPIAGSFWAIATIFFYYVTFSYQYAWPPVLALLPVYTLSVYPSFGLPITIRFVLCYLLIAYILYLFTSIIVSSYRKARFYAENDHLTGLLNRRIVMDEVERWVNYNQRSHDIEVTIVLIDLDQFKSINDKFGHQIGDKVLADFGHCLRASVRKTDIAGRYGGEEFLLVLPSTDSHGACKLLTSLRERLAQYTLPDNSPIQFSSGIAPLTKDCSATKWLARADKALYSSKGKGRNCDSHN